MNKWIAEFELEDGDTMPEHMDLEYKGIKIDFHCRPLEQEPKTGHWIDINNHHYYNDGDIETTELRCSCCNEEVEWDIELLHKPYFCENCGADMREVEE